MNYQHTETKDILSYTQLAAAYPTVSLAPDGTELMLDFWRVITPTDRPPYNQYTEKVVEIAPVNYTQTWTIEPLFIEEIDQNIINAKEYKHSESSDYAAELVDEANANPYIGKQTTAKKNQRRVSVRVNNSTNGKPKSQQDKKRDEAMADHSNASYDAQDNCDGVIDAMGDAQSIYDLDVTIAVTWPTWTPPE